MVLEMKMVMTNLQEQTIWMWYRKPEQVFFSASTYLLQIITQKVWEQHCASSCKHLKVTNFTFLTQVFIGLKGPQTAVTFVKKQNTPVLDICLSLKPLCFSLLLCL